MSTRAEREYTQQMKLLNGAAPSEFKGTSLGSRRLILKALNHLTDAERAPIISAARLEKVAGMKPKTQSTAVAVVEPKPSGKIMTKLSKPAAPAMLSYDRAKILLAKAVTVDEVKNVKGIAAAMRAYGRQANDLDYWRNGELIQARALRRLGEMIEGQKKAGLLSKGGNAKKHAALKNSGAVITLEDAGIDNNPRHAAKLAHATTPEQEAEIVEQWENVIEAKHKVPRLVIAPPKPPKDAPDPNRGKSKLIKVTSDIVRWAEWICEAIDDIELSAADKKEVRAGALRAASACESLAKKCAVPPEPANAYVDHDDQAEAEAHHTAVIAGRNGLSTRMVSILMDKWSEDHPVVAWADFREETTASGMQVTTATPVGGGCKEFRWDTDAELVAWAETKMTKAQVKAWRERRPFNPV